MSKGVVKLHNLRDFDPAEMVAVFLHIPKCGGTSIHTTLTARLGGNYKVLMTQNDFDSHAGDVIAFGGHNTYETKPITQINKYRVYVTILRDPLERFLSFYKHIIDHPLHHLPKQFPQLLAMSPFEFAQAMITLGNQGISNFQCKTVIGRSEFLPSADRALQNLVDNFSIVAPATAQKAFLRDMATMLRAEPLEELRHNQSQTSLNPTDICEKLIELHSIVNSEDELLYKGATSAFGWHVA